MAQKKRRSTTQAFVEGFLFANENLDGYAPKDVAAAVLTAVMKHPQRLSVRPAFDAGLDLQDDVAAALQSFPRFQSPEPEPTPDGTAPKKLFKKIR